MSPGTQHLHGGPPDPLHKTRPTPDHPNLRRNHDPLALVAALYLAFGRRGGALGLAAFLLYAFSLAALTGVEFVINLVLADLPRHTVDALRAGTLGIALTVASASFLLGTVAFVATLLRGSQVTTVPLVLCAGWSGQGSGGHSSQDCVPAETHPTSVAPPWGRRSLEAVISTVSW